MPYIASPDEGTIREVRNALLAIALRHSDTGDDAFLRLPRSVLYTLTGLQLRREDFNASVRFLAGETDSVRETTGTGSRPDVLLDKIVDEVGEWITVLYAEFPEDEPEPADLVALLGLDVDQPIPTDLLIRRRPRARVVHDPAIPRRCARCGETKPTADFGRRSADPEAPEYQRFQSYCNPCDVARHRAAGYGDDRKQRPERWKDNGRAGARHPNSVATGFYRPSTR